MSIEIFAMQSQFSIAISNCGIFLWWNLSELLENVKYYCVIIGSRERRWKKSAAAPTTSSPHFLPSASTPWRKVKWTPVVKRQTIKLVGTGQIQCFLQWSGSLVLHVEEEPEHDESLHNLDIFFSLMYIAELSFLW